MNFHPLTLLVSLVLIITAAAGALIHHNDATSTPEVLSWKTTSTVPQPVYTAGTTTVATTPSSTLFKVISTLPTFTFAQMPAIQASVRTDNSSKNISSINSYLNNTGNNPIIPTFNIVVPRGDGASSDAAPTETTSQQALHAYGNSAGTIVRALDSSHPNANTDLQTFFNKPTDTTAIPIIKISNDLTEAGNTLASLNAVPGEILPLHQALAAAYTDAGEKLAAVAEMRTPADIATALAAYNKSVDNVSAAYVNIVLMYKDQKIQFGSTEAGSVFMFSNS